LREELLNCFTRAMLTPFTERHTFKKPRKKDENKLRNAMNEINSTIEDIPLSTVITDVKTLDDFVYAVALIAIKNAKD